MRQAPRQMQVPRRQRYLNRRQALLTERKSFEAAWRDCSDHILSRRTRFLAGDRNKKRRNTKIINPWPRIAQETLVSFLVENMASKGQPWFEVQPRDPGLLTSRPVQEYIEHLLRVFRDLLARSNFYSATKTVITDLVVFGSACAQIDEDDDDVFRVYNWPIGQYCFANSSRLQVDTVYRDFSMTTAQLVERYGFENCSMQVQTSWNRHQYDEWFEVLHVVEPNRLYDPNRRVLGPDGQPFRSCFMEITGDEKSDRLLAEEGNFEFPLVCPRWDVLGEDVYGTSLGMDAVGACTALQHMEGRLALLIDKTVSPTMVGPTSMANRPTSTLAGDWMFADAIGGGKAIQPAFEIREQAIGECRENIAMYVEQIAKIFKNDVWLYAQRAKPGGEDVDLTATEVQIRREEALQLISPMTERIEDEYFEVALRRIMAIAGRKGLLPPPPPELIEETPDGRLVTAPLKIEFISSMAQARKAVATGGISRFLSVVEQVQAIQTAPRVQDDARDHVDFAQVLRETADAVSAPVRLIKDPEVVEQQRAAAAEADRAAQETALASERAKAMRDLASAPVESGNALGRMLEDAEEAA